MNKVFIRLKEKETGIESDEISIEELIYNQHDIEFRFPDEELEYTILPYKDFLFYQNDYEVIIRILRRRLKKQFENEIIGGENENNL